jgi:hypothetical protein
MKGLVVVFAALVGCIAIFASQSAASASVSLPGMSKAKPAVSSPITPIQLKDKDKDDDVKPPKDKPKKSKKNDGKDDDDDDGNAGGGNDGKDKGKGK